MTSAPLRSRLLALGLAAALLAGCGYPNRGRPLARLGSNLGLAPESAAYDPPRLRLGVMPFDAWYSPWEPLDADALGVHRHAPGFSLPLLPVGGRSAEASRGVLYTERAGFLDIAHLRNAVDLTLFVHREVAPRLRRDEVVTLELLAAEPDLYRLTLAAPPWATPAERDAAAVEVAGRVAYLMTTWHEVLTWFGYRGLGVITEQPSAFSYDDAASHRVGVELAMRVLRELAPDPTRASEPGDLELDEAAFDAAVTAALPPHLRSLGVVPPAEATARMRAVEGAWWDGGRPLLRVIDLGLDGSPLRARLAPAAASGAQQAEPGVRPGVEPGGRPGVTWDFDPALAVAGVPLSKWFDVAIEPATFEAGRIRAAAGVGPGDAVRPRRDFPRLEAALLAMPAP